MGTLNLPATGLVYVDTGPVIYSVEKDPDLYPLMLPLWQAMKAGRIEVASSSLTLLETLVIPIKQNDSILIGAYEGLLTNSEMHLIPITTDILRKAAQLRARFNLKTPDAIHAATALSEGCVQFITNDGGFRRVAGLNVVVLKDLI
jgi:predicted nucleic acid-binding protein